MENKLTYTRAEACKALQVSLPTLDAFLKRSENPLPSIRVSARGGDRCGKVLIPVSRLTAWLDEEAIRNSGRAI